MPFYNDLRPAQDHLKRDFALIFPDMKLTEKKRTIKNLLDLRDGLCKIANKRADENPIVASWNIKEFGNTTQRLEEAYFYIAEILSKFDLIAIQEVKSTLYDLYIIMRLLGSDWAYVVNDITEGQAGNSERSAYLYNKKRVEFAGLAGEIVLWDKLTQNSDVKQLKRTPYITGFKAGWKTFAMVNIHLHPGKDDEDIIYRRKEVELLIKALEEKFTNRRLWNENIILVGDFNLYKGPQSDDPTIQVIHDAGYEEVESLKGLDTNASMTEAYDRFFIKTHKYFTLGKTSQGIDNGGVFNPFEYVYKIGQEQTYRNYMIAHYTGEKDLDDHDNLVKYFMHPWRKNQISDHFPIWFELLIDSSDEFLRERLESYS